jgi:hypothetical protein
MTTVPLSVTNIRFLSNVPFSSDYKHTRWFDNVDDQLNWFMSQNIVHQNSNANYQRIDRTFIKANASVDDLYNANYVMFQNKQYKWFFAFVTSLEYVNESVTKVHFQVDVLQTWMFVMNFKPSFVIREHCPLWNSDGTPVINTVDEGLYYGAEYDNVNVSTWLPFTDLYFMVIVSKNAMHLTTPAVTPVVNGMPTPLSYYVHPFKLDGSSIQYGSNPLNNMTDVLTNLYSNTDAVNNIVAIYVTDYIGYAFTYDQPNGVLTGGDSQFEQVNIGSTGSPIQTIHVKNIQNYQALTHSLGDKYAPYYGVTESKLLMYPYTVLILDDMKGNRVQLRNEYIDSETLNIVVRGSIGMDNKIAYSVKEYLTGGLPYNQLEVSLENSVINNNPNDVPILNDNLAAFLQGNRNTIQNQKNSIMFNGAMSTANNTLGALVSAGEGNIVGAIGGGMNVVSGLGNTQLKLNAIQAKQDDIRNTPPTLVKMGNNTAFDYGNKYNGLYIIQKQIKPEYVKKLSDYFNMFGYKKNEVKIPNFHTRQSWNYVQTAACTITGNFANEDLVEIKQIFDNGITLWHVDDIGNYTLKNGVL